MEDNDIPNQLGRNGKFALIGAAGIAVLTTINVIVQVFIHWHSFVFVSKCEAVLLLAFLTIIPVAALWDKKAAEKELFTRLQIMIVGYICLMLAIGLFAT